MMRNGEGGLNVMYASLEVLLIGKCCYLGNFWGVGRRDWA